MESLKCLIILSSCIMLHDRVIAWHMILWHCIQLTWHWHIKYLTLILDTWQLTCYHLIFDMLTLSIDTVTPDWILLHWTPVLHCLFMIITFMGTWHDYYTATIWYSWTSVVLNSCIFEPLKQGDSWYYTHVDSHSWLTMDIGLLWIHCGHYHWTICNNWTT